MWKHSNIPHTLLTWLQLIFTSIFNWNQQWGDYVCDAICIVKNVEEGLNRLSQNGVPECFQHLCSCWQKCIVVHGDYSEGNVAWMIVLFCISQKYSDTGTCWSYHLIYSFRVLDCNFHNYDTVHMELSCFYQILVTTYLSTQFRNPQDRHCISITVRTSNLIYYIRLLYFLIKVKNETSYAMGLYYKKSVLDAHGVEHIGESTNP
jgi:hypothetical protein